MDLQFRLHQIRSTGLRIALAKLKRKLQQTLSESLRRRRFRRARVLSNLGESPAHPLAQILSAKDIVLSEDHRRIIREAADHALAHEYYIAGLGWTRNVHACEVRGFEGKIFRQEPLPVELDPEGDWIGLLIESPHAEESTLVWRQIEQPYTPVDWQRDLRSGYAWSEGQWIHDLPMPYDRGGDPKVPWDFGRMHQLLWLALDYTQSDDAARRQVLLREFRSHLLDFIALNPPASGIQWRSPMDVAIRVANMLVAHDILRSASVVFDTAFSVIFHRSVREHASFVMENLEFSDGMRANHFLANLAGLAVCAAYLHEDEYPRGMKELLSTSLPEETLLQFYTDGGNFEASTNYHRLSAEMLFWAIAFCEHAGIKILGHSAECDSRLRAIAQWSSEIVYSSGLAAQIGDNDSGRFLPLIPFFPDKSEPDRQHDFRSLLQVQSAFYSKQELPRYSSLEYNVVKSLLAKSSASRDSAATSSTRKAGSAFHASESGISVYHRDVYDVVLRAGSIGQRGRGGHAHNDQLSICVAVDGVELICDAGTYVYTASSEKRNLFRSSALHSTLTVDSLEQNDLPRGSAEKLFWMLGDRAQASVLQASDTDWLAEHKGYDSPHRRACVISDSAIEITDHYLGTKSAAVCFQLHPECRVVQNSATSVDILRNTRCIRLETSGTQLQVVSSHYAPMYGWTMPTQRIVIKASAETTTLLTIVKPS